MKLECAEAWLARTRDCPVLIMIACMSSARFQGARQSLLDLDLPHCGRWRHAKFTGSFTAVELSVIRDNLGRLELESLEITSQWLASESDAFEIAPKQ